MKPPEITGLVKIHIRLKLCFEDIINFKQVLQEIKTNVILN